MTFQHARPAAASSWRKGRPFDPPPLEALEALVEAAVKAEAVEATVEASGDGDSDRTESDLEPELAVCFGQATPAEPPVAAEEKTAADDSTDSDAASELDVCFRAEPAAVHAADETPVRMGARSAAAVETVEAPAPPPPDGPPAQTTWQERNPEAAALALARAERRREMEREHAIAAAAAAAERAAEPPRPPTSHICFLASHIATPKRYQMLTRCLTSIAAQTEPITIWLSWSSGSDDHTRNMRDFLDKVKRNGACRIDVDICHGRRRLSQFQHFHHLVTSPEGQALSPDTWLLFTDDDDVWSPFRADFYANHCKKAASKGIDVVQARVKCRPTVDLLFTEVTVADPSSSVDGLLVKGRVGMADSAKHVKPAAYDTIDPDAPDGGDGVFDPDDVYGSFHMAEYFDFSCRYHVLSTFLLKRCPTVLLRHRLCDLAFNLGCLSKHTNRLIVAPDDSEEWLYYYSTMPPSLTPKESAWCKPASASSIVDVTRHECELAEQCLAAGDPRILYDDDLNEHDLAHFLACIRGGLEQELIQTRVEDGGAHPPRQIVHAMCRRQRDAVLSRHPVGDAAKEDGEASLATLRKWALDVTTERLLILVLRNFAFDGLIDWDTFAYEPISERGCNDPTGCLVEALRAVAGDEAADAWFGSVNVKLE